MADDPLSTFTSRLRPKNEPVPTPKPTLPPTIVPHDVDGRQEYGAYEPFENEVRTVSVEIRCYRSGLSYFIPYAHMGAIVFNFRTGGEIFFTGAGHAVTVRGRNLRTLVLALRLHSCATIQDFSPESHVLPEPVDMTAPFVESIEVEVLRPPKPGDAVT